jgi:hypothetical protein
MPKMGELVRVENKERRFGANDHYYCCKLQNGDTPLKLGDTTLEPDEEAYLLFTEHQLEVALVRSTKNPEDIAKVGWLRDLLD